MVAVETLRINVNESLLIEDKGDGWQSVSLALGRDRYMVGVGRSRNAALEQARANLQQALNIVDVAILRGPAS